MLQRLLIVYYGKDRLPYKDENREVHYPIVNSTSGGTLITGENNTSKLYFYVGLIGGSGRQWIANIKKPDGTLAYQLCTNGQYVQLANGFVDYRVELDIAGLFADQIGDVYIGIQGYSGDTVIVEDNDTYEISGDPIVLATGTIKIKVNYAPNTLPKGETLAPTVEQLILASLGSKADKSETIFVTPDIDTLNLNNFNENQLFLDENTRSFYKLVGGELEVFQLSVADLFDAYTKAESDAKYVPLTDVSTSAYASKIVQRDLSAQINVVETPTQDYHATSKKYVDTLVSTIKANAYIPVNTTNYPTLEDFLESTGEEGYLYLYPIDTSDLSEGYHQYIYEGSSWVYMGDTTLNLTNYVDLTSNQTITGVKTFTNEIDLNNVSATDQGKIVYSEYSRMNFFIGSTAILDIRGSGAVLRGSFLPTFDNSYDIGSSTYAWKDVYLAGDIKSGTNYITINNTYGNFAIYRNNELMQDWSYGSSSIAGTLRPRGNTYNLGNASYLWQDLFLSRNITDGTISFSPYIVIGKYTADNTITELDYDTISVISISVATTFTLKTAPTGCYPEYRAFITNSGSSAIALTFPSGTVIKCNDDTVTIASNVATLPAGMKVEVSIVDDSCILYNKDAQ